MNVKGKKMSEKSHNSGIAHSSSLLEDSTTQFSLCQRGRTLLSFTDMSCHAKSLVFGTRPWYNLYRSSFRMDKIQQQLTKFIRRRGASRTERRTNSVMHSFFPTEKFFVVCVLHGIVTVCHLLHTSLCRFAWSLYQKV